MPTPPAHSLAVRLRAARSALGLTQTDFASLVRVADLRTVRRWESGVVPVPGPVAILVELLEAGVALPAAPPG